MLLIMRLHLRFIATLTIIFILTIGLLEAEENEFNADHEAWTYYERGEIDKALSTIEKLNTPESEYRGGLLVLLGIIYFEKQRYHEALEALNKVRPRLESIHLQMKDNPNYIGNKEAREFANFLYYKMLVISAFSNFYMEKCPEALKDFLAYVGDYQEPFIYSNIAICYYKINDYAKSMDYFKLSYQFPSFLDKYEETGLRYKIAYNIGALNALLGNVDEVITWLKIPLGHDKKKWLGEIRKDKDFDSIRENEKFKTFLKQEGDILLPN